MAHVSIMPSVEFSVAGSRVPAFDPLIEECRNVIPDEELVKRSLRGEEDAFQRLYERYKPSVYAAVYRIVLDPEEAQDATQEIFITIYRSLAIWSPQRARFFPWIFKVATNRAIDHWRIRRRRAEVPLNEIVEKQSHGALPCRATLEPMERTVEHRERVAEVWRFVAELPQSQRRFIVLRYCYGLKLKEIAEMEGCKLGTVKSALHRATNTMRFKLRRLYKRRHANSQETPIDIGP
jgi:RNA polymerase sigma-70 factor (ECF subfamily)